MTSIWEYQTQPLPIVQSLLGPVGETTSARYIRLKHISDVTGRRFFRLCLDYERQAAFYRGRHPAPPQTYTRNTRGPNIQAHTWM